MIPKTPSRTPKQKRRLFRSPYVLAQESAMMLLGPGVKDMMHAKDRKAAMDGMAELLWIGAAKHMFCAL